MFYIDSPLPRRSPGRNELRLDGVARDWSAVSRVAEPHRLAVVVLLGQPVLQVSPGVLGLLVELRQGPDEAPPCCDATCCSSACASQSVGFSAKMVVLPSTQLFKAVCAWNKMYPRLLKRTA